MAEATCSTRRSDGPVVVITSERALHHEVMLHIAREFPDLIAVPVPNGFWLGGFSPHERVTVARLINMMKCTGQLLPGAPDIVLLTHGWSGCIELKRPMQRTLSGKARAGKPSDAQLAFAARCSEHGIRYAVCDSWEMVRDTILQWNESINGNGAGNSRINAHVAVVGIAHR